MDKTRKLALEILYKIDKEGAYSNIVLNEMLNKNKNNLNKKDIGLISEIVYGVTTWKLTLDEIIKNHSSVKIKKISPWILNILRMSIYQIVFLDKIPKSAAVNEGVNLAKRYGNKGSIGFTNAVLRKIDKKDYEDLFEIKDKKEMISKTTSMPIWIIEEFIKEGLTYEQIKEICRNSNKRPNISIRVNKLKTTKESLIEKLKAKNIDVTEKSELDDFIILNKAKDIENMEEFKQGLFTVQDEAAGLTALILNPKENEEVLDACSSPGGKTTYMAEIMKNKGKIEALDIHEHRTKLVEDAANRLGINIIKVHLQDATKFNKEYEEKFDKVLLDVPCLGIGVLKRKPDIKWQRKVEDIKKITKVQTEILNTCSSYLKKGGELVYSTCSIFKSENQDIINKFVEENENFKIQEIILPKHAEDIKNYFKKFIIDRKFLQVYQNQKTDGFFICKLLRVK